MIILNHNTAKAGKIKWRKKLKVFHFAADRITGHNNEDKLNSWYGQGQVLTASNPAFAPDYLTDIQNGLPSAWFDGVNDIMTLTAPHPISFISGLDKAFTIMVALKSDLNAINEFQTFLSLNHDTDADPWINLRQKFSNTSWQMRKHSNDNGEAAKQRAGGTADTDAHVLTLIDTGISSEFFEDNVSVGSGNSNLTDSMSLQTLAFGALWAGGSPSAYFTGHLLEVKIWARALPGGVRSNQETQLMTKWGI